MSYLTLINGSIRNLPVFPRILVIGVISTVVTYVLVGLMTGLLRFVYTLVSDYTLWFVIPVSILIGVCTGKGDKNGGGIQRSILGIGSVIMAFVVVWIISGVMNAVIGFVEMRVPVFVVSMAAVSMVVHYEDIKKLAKTEDKESEPAPERNRAN